MIKVRTRKLISIIILATTFVGCNPLDTYYNTSDYIEDKNKEIQDKDVSGNFIKECLDKNEEVNRLFEDEESSTVKVKKKKENFLGK